MSVADAAAGDRPQLSGFSRLVAFISDSRRAALSRLIAERTSVQGDTLRFAANTDELQGVVTSGSLVLIEGSRLPELAAVSRVRERAASASDWRGRFDLGAAAEALGRLPTATRRALAQVLEAPRLWSVKRWAHVAGVSPRQLVRQCRAAGFVAVPKDILLAARLASACALLCSGHTLSLPELARACGWVDVRSFRGALRRAGFSSPAALAQLTTTQGTLGALLERLSTRRA